MKAKESNSFVIRLLLWLAVHVPSEALSAWLIERAVVMSGGEPMDDEAPEEMTPPTAEEIAEWADSVVYGQTPDGVDVFYEPQSQAWRKVEPRT